MKQIAECGKHIPVMPNSYKPTVIDNRQRIGPTDRNNVHNPAINLEIMQTCCEPAKVKLHLNSLKHVENIKLSAARNIYFYVEVCQRYQELCNGVPSISSCHVHHIS